MRVLFITRKYPPRVGGMEQFSYGLFTHLEAEKKLIALRHSQILLPLWVLYTFFRSVFFLSSVDIIYISDGLLAPLGMILKTISKKPLVITVHGLDVVWPKFWYQKFFVPCLKSADYVVCVSRSTERECQKRDIKNTCVIPNAIDSKNFETEKHFSFSGKRVLLSVGRQIPRKGFLWFAERVLPLLPKDILYVVVGGGGVKPLKYPKVQEWGKISHKKLSALYRSADLMIIPNISIQGDTEGFCITAIEASSQGLPVIASKIEGLTDSVLDGKTGFLIESQNPGAWRKKIMELLEVSVSERDFLRKRTREETQKHFSWDSIQEKYKKLFFDVCHLLT